MTRPTRHLCIATGQNLANLIPALQLNAETVFILETPEMRASARNLKRALESHGIEVTRVPFDDSTPESIITEAERVAMQLGEGALVFNATGGHKLMTLALAEHMKLADNLHLLYAETRRDRLDWLLPSPEIQPMHDVLSLDDILLAQGYRRVRDGNRDVQWQIEADRRAALTRKLGDEAAKLAGFFGTLNRLADDALNEPNGPFRPRQEFAFSPGGRNAELLRAAQELGLLRWDEDTEIVFASPEAARYFRGGWLEEYAWVKLRGIRPHDWAVNLVAETQGAEASNEFDGLVAHRNRLLVLECKTAAFGRDELKDASHIYKLAQVSRKVGGIMSRSLLLSAREVSDPVRQRAKEYEVDILAADEVATLVDYLRAWMAVCHS